MNQRHNIEPTKKLAESAGGQRPGQEQSEASLQLTPPAGLAFLLIFILLAAGIITAGWFYSRKSAQQYIVEIERQLAAIADLKADELMQWRKERIGDAGILFKNASFSALVKGCLKKPADADAQRQLQIWLEKYGTHFRYDHIRLLDAKGVTRLSSPEGLPEAASIVVEHAAKALQLGQVMLQDFYRSADDQTVRLALLIPVLDEQDANGPLGVLVLRIDPTKYLYPFIKRWPTTSPTAETLLLRCDGNDVLYLNDLRHQTNTVLSLRVPLTRTTVPAVRAVLGERGFMGGQDYRGVPVVAIAQAVPDSPWFLVAKIDAAEIYAPLLAQHWQVIVTIGVLLFTAGAGVGLVWRQQRVRFYRKQANLMVALQQSELKYRILVENANAIVYSLTPDGVFTYVSPAWTRILGHDISEVINHPFQPFVHPDDVSKCVDFLKRTIQTGVAQAGVEYRVLHKDGNWRWHTTNASPLHDDSGNVIAYIAIGHDITEHKHAEEALIESDERFRRLFEFSPDPAWIIDDHRFVECNQAAINILGYPGKESLRNTHPSELSPEFQPDGESSYSKAERMMFIAQEKGLNRFEWVHKRWDKSDFFAEVTLSPVTIKGRHIIYCIWRDITERKNSEEALQLSSKALQTKNAELERFLYTASHDLRTPVVTIQSFARCLERDMAASDSTRAEEAVKFIKSSADTMVHMLDDVLEMSRVGRLTGASSNVAVRAVVDDGMNAVTGLITKHGVAVEIAAMDVSLYGDRHRFAEIWQNLIENACKFMGDQATPCIEIGVRYGEAAERQSTEGGTLAVESESHYAPPVKESAEAFDPPTPVFFVRDNGIGIDPSCHTRVFNLFERLDKKIEGTGMGLSIVKRIVELYQGRIWIESAGAGQGTCFCFTLPGAIKVPKVTA